MPIITGATLFGLTSSHGTADLHPEHQINVFFLISPGRTVVDLLLLKQFARDVKSQLLDSLQSFTSLRIGTTHSQEFMQKCLFETVEHQMTNDCTAIKQAQFIAVKMQAYADEINQLESFIQVNLAKVEHLLPQVFWENHSEKAIRIFPYRTYRFDVVPSTPSENEPRVQQTNRNHHIHNIQPTTTYQTESESTKMFSIGTTTAEATVTQRSNVRNQLPPQQVLVDSKAAEIHIEVIPFLESSITKFIYQGDHNFENSFTFEMSYEDAVLTVAHKSKDILMDLTSFFIQSPKEQFRSLATANNTIGSDITDSWTTILGTLADFMKEPIFVKLEAMMRTFKSINKGLAKQINLCESLQVISQEYPSALFNAVLGDVANILSIAKPQLQYFGSIIPTLVSALRQPTVYMSTAPSCHGTYPSIHFNTLGYASATILRVNPFVLQEVNQPFVISYFPVGISILWIVDGLSYMAKTRLPEDSQYQMLYGLPKQAYLQELPLLSQPVQIQNPQVWQCISAIQAQHSAAAIKACNFSISAPYANTWYMQGNLLVFSLQQQIAITIICQCRTSLQWLDVNLIGSGTAQIPLNCQVYEKLEPPVNPNVLRELRALQGGNLTHCSPEDILETVIYERTLPRIDDLARFILKNHVFAQNNIKFAMRQLKEISAQAINGTLLDQAMKSITAAPGQHKDIPNSILEWFEVPSNIITVTLTTITMIIWIVLLIRCHKHRCDCKKDDVTEEIELIRRDIRANYSELHSNGFMTPRSPE